jgi:hypothetical protein
LDQTVLPKIAAGLWNSVLSKGSALAGLMHRLDAQMFVIIIITIIITL